MKRTHKKILGFAGLGLVAATTAVAVNMPSPMASAVSSVTDTIQIRVMSPNPDLVVTSTSGATITDPEYNFSVSYGNITNIKATLVNYDGDGNVKHSEVIWNETSDGTAGSKDFSLNLDNYGGRGYLTITFVGTGVDGVSVEKILSVAYIKESEEANPEPGSDETEVDIDIPSEEVQTVVVNIYDDGGNLVDTISISDPGDLETLDLSHLGDGTYTLEVVTKDTTGDVIESTTVIAVVDQDGPASRPTIPITVENQDEPVGEVKIDIKDEEGNIVKTITVANPVPGSVVDVDTDDLPSGGYTITTTYYNGDGEVISSNDVSATITNEDGKAGIAINTVVDSVSSVEAYIYDTNGKLVRILKANRATGIVYVYDENNNLLFTINGGYANGKITISMEGLPYGNYTGMIMYRNKNGKLVGDSDPISIKYYGKAIVVPDTGSFFQGLNITREDYLITGLIVFVTIGVVAFGIVKKNRGQTNKKDRINGRVRH